VGRLRTFGRWIPPRVPRWMHSTSSRRWTTPPDTRFARQQTGHLEGALGRSGGPVCPQGCSAPSIGLDHYDFEVHVHLRAGRLSLGRCGDGDWRGGCEGLRRGGGGLDVLHPRLCVVGVVDPGGRQRRRLGRRRSEWAGVGWDPGGSSVNGGGWCLDLPSVRLCASRRFRCRPVASRRGQTRGR
jgi:hypothetical protein